MQGYIQDFPREGALNPTGGGIPIFELFYLTNSTELKETGPVLGGWVDWVGSPMLCIHLKFLMGIHLYRKIFGYFFNKLFVYSVL